MAQNWRQRGTRRAVARHGAGPPRPWSVADPRRPENDEVLSDCGGCHGGHEKPCDAVHDGSPESRPNAHRLPAFPAAIPSDTTSPHASSSDGATTMSAAASNCGASGRASAIRKRSPSPCSAHIRASRDLVSGREGSSQPTTRPRKRWYGPACLGERRDEVLLPLALEDATELQH